MPTRMCRNTLHATRRHGNGKESTGENSSASSDLEHQHEKWCEVGWHGCAHDGQHASEFHATNTHWYDSGSSGEPTKPEKAKEGDLDRGAPARDERWRTRTSPHVLHSNRVVRSQTARIRSAKVPSQLEKKGEAKATPNEPPREDQPDGKPHSTKGETQCKDQAGGRAEVAREGSTRCDTWPSHPLLIKCETSPRSYVCSDPIPHARLQRQEILRSYDGKGKLWRVGTV